MFDHVKCVWGDSVNVSVCVADRLEGGKTML